MYHILEFVKVKIKEIHLYVIFMQQHLHPLHLQIHASLLHVDQMLYVRWPEIIRHVLVYLISLDLLQTADQNV